MVFHNGQNEESLAHLAEWVWTLFSRCLGATEDILKIHRNLILIEVEFIGQRICIFKVSIDF